MLVHFDKCFVSLIKVEGLKLTNRKADLGKETYAGISRKHFPNLGIWKEIDRIKKNFPQKQWNRLLKVDTIIQSEVKSFYKKKFWDAARLDEVKDYDVCHEIFDSYVNIGGKVKRWVQEALNNLNQNEGKRYWKDIKEDGKIGPTTIRTLNAAIKKPKIWSRFLKDMNIAQGYHYRTLARKKKSQELNYGGWLDQRVTLPVRS